MAISNQQRCQSYHICMFQVCSNKGVKTEGLNKVGHTRGQFYQLHVIQHLWSELKAIFFKKKTNASETNPFKT